MIHDGHQAVALFAVLANAATPVSDAATIVDIITRGGPLGLLILALIWLERERKADRARCDEDHGKRDRHIADLREDLERVRDDGEQRHRECREELRQTTERLVAMIKG